MSRPPMVVIVRCDGEVADRVLRAAQTYPHASARLDRGVVVVLDRPDIVAAGDARCEEERVCRWLTEVRDGGALVAWSTWLARRGLKP